MNRPLRGQCSHAGECRGWGKNRHGVGFRVAGVGAPVPRPTMQAAFAPPVAWFSAFDAVYQHGVGLDPVVICKDGSDLTPAAVRAHL